MKMFAITAMAFKHWKQLSWKWQITGWVSTPESLGTDSWCVNTGLIFWCGKVISSLCAISFLLQSWSFLDLLGRMKQCYSPNPDKKSFVSLSPTRMKKLQYEQYLYLHLKSEIRWKMQFKKGELLSIGLQRNGWNFLSFKSLTEVI